MVSSAKDSFSLCFKKEGWTLGNKCRIIIRDENPSGIDQRKWQAYLSHYVAGSPVIFKSHVNQRLSLSVYILVDLLKQGLVLNGSGNVLNKQSLKRSYFHCWKIECYEKLVSKDLQSSKQFCLHLRNFSLTANAVWGVFLWHMNKQSRHRSTKSTRRLPSPEDDHPSLNSLPSKSSFSPHINKCSNNFLKSFPL